jgi:hypothetical protein
MGDPTNTTEGAGAPSTTRWVAPEVAGLTGSGTRGGTLALHTHASVPEGMREAMAVTERIVWLSVGIEDLEGPTQDLGRALA